MRKLPLALLLVAGAAAADPSTVKLSYEAKDQPKALAAMTKEAEKHVAALDKAAHGKDYELRIVLKKLDQTADSTTCNVGIIVGKPTLKMMLASISGGATAKAGGEVGIEDCVSTTLGDLLDKRVAPLVEKKSKI